MPPNEHENRQLALKIAAEHASENAMASEIVADAKLFLAFLDAESRHEMDDHEETPESRAALDTFLGIETK